MTDGINCLLLQPFPNGASAHADIPLPSARHHNYGHKFLCDLPAATARDKGCCCLCLRARYHRMWNTSPHEQHRADHTGAEEQGSAGMPAS